MRQPVEVRRRRPWRGARRETTADASVPRIGWGRLAFLLGALCAASVLPAIAQEEAAGPEPTRRSTGSVILLELTSETGELVGGARVELQPIDEAHSNDGAEAVAREAGEGRYAIDGLSSGRYRILVTAPGHREHRSTVRLRQGERRKLRLRLPRRPLSLPEILAVAGRTEAGELLGHAVDHLRLRDQPLAAATLAEWLEGLPGVQVRRSAAGRQLVSIRGSRPEGVLVLLDGVPLNDPVAGVADLTTVPAATLESATLVRGAASEYGPGALAGVLILRSVRPDGTSASAGIETGSFGRRAADAYAAAGGEAGQVSVGVRVESGENDFSFENRILPGQPRETRQNADFHSVHAFLSGQSKALPLSLRLRVDDVERGAPGRMGTALYDRARWEEEAVQATAEVGEVGDRGGVLSYRRRALRYRDPRVAQDETQRVRELHLRGQLPLGAGWRASGHLQHGSVAGDGLMGEPSRMSGGVALGGRLGGEEVAARPAIALDLADRRVFGSPSLAVTVRPSTSWTFWSRAGRAVRLPTFGDLYFASARRLRPNPELRPERVVLDIEAGATWMRTDGRAGARAGAFHRRTREPIVWLASAVAVWSPQNLDRLTAEGVEAGAFWRPGDGWRLDASGGWERSRVGFGNNRNPLPYAPFVQGRASLERAWAGRAARLELRGVGSRTSSLAGTHRLPDVVLLDLAARQDFAVQGLPMRIDLRLRNALNERYELVALFPEPGRSFTLRVQVGPGRTTTRSSAAAEEPRERE